MAFCRVAVAAAAEAFAIRDIAMLEVTKIDCTPIGAYVDVTGCRFDPAPGKELSVVSALATINGDEAQIAIHYDRADGVIWQIELYFHAGDSLNIGWNRKFDGLTFDSRFG